MKRMRSKIVATVLPGQEFPERATISSAQIKSDKNFVALELYSFISLL